MRANSGSTFMAHACTHAINITAKRGIVKNSVHFAGIGYRENPSPPSISSSRIAAGPKTSMASTLRINGPCNKYIEKLTLPK